MVIAAALDRPGLRLTAVELMALRPPLRASRHRPASRRPGAIAAKSPGQGMDLREIRAFAEGDDLRRVDPSATARTGHLHVRSFHEDRDDTTLLIADFRGGMLWGTGAALRSVRIGRWLMHQGWLAALRGGSVALLAAGDGVPVMLTAGTGTTQMQSVATALARAHDAAVSRHLGNDTREASLAPALALALRMAPPGGQVQVATGPDGLGGIDAALSRLSKGRNVTVNIVLDPAETQPSPLPVSVSDGQTSRHGQLLSLDLAPILAHLGKLGVKVRTVMPDDAG